MFELYVPSTNRMTRADPRVGVTFRRQGLLTLSLEANRLLGKPEAVVILYNKETNEIAIKRCDPNDSGAHRVKVTAGQAPHINLSGFIRHIGRYVPAESTFVQGTSETDESGAPMVKVSAFPLRKSLV